MNVIEKMTSLEQTLFWTAAALGGVVAIFGIAFLVVWIKYSWIKNNNSLNVTGGQLTEEIFKRNGVSAQVRPRWMYVKYWNHNKRRDTYALRPWTYERKSIWTLMEATQQAYATTIRQTKPKTFYLAFRMPNLIGIVSSLVGVGIIAYMIYKNDEISGWKDFTILGLAISIIVVGQATSFLWRAAHIKKHAIGLIRDLGFTDQELRQIQFIYTFVLAMAIARMIYELIKLAFKIARSVNQNGGNSK